MKERKVDGEKERRRERINERMNKGENG